MARYSSAAPTARSPHLLQRWIVAASCAVAIATIVGVVVPPELKAAPGVLAAVLVFAGVVLTGRKSIVELRLREDAERRERLARQLAEAARERSAILFGHNLREVLTSIDGLARQPPSERTAEVPAVRQSVAVQAKEGVSALSSRAAYLRVGDLTAKARCMAPDKVASSPDRHDGFTTVFLESSPADADVWSILDGSAPTAFVEDVARWAAARGDDRCRSYGTFITARVEAGGIPFGLLTVNALAPETFVRDDVTYVEALARILAIVELLCLTTPAYRRARDASLNRHHTPTRSDRISLNEGGAP